MSPRITALPRAQSPLIGMDVNKVGIRTGWTTGEIIDACANTAIFVYHPDGVFRRTRLHCYIRADTPVNSGDSGSALFATISDRPGSENDGIFLGILSACAGCIKTHETQTADDFHVLWTAIDAAMN